MIQRHFKRLKGCPQKDKSMDKRRKGLKGTELKSLRMRLGYSGRAFSKKLGIDHSLYLKYEKGVRPLTEEKVYEIKQTLGFLSDKERADLQIHIDYLKLTFFDTTPEIVIEHVMGINPRWFVKENRKKHNYDFWFQCGALVLMSKKDQTQGVLLDLTGEGVVQFEEYLEERGLTLQSWLKQVLDPAFYTKNGLYSRIHSTRLDIAIDEMYKADGTNFDLKKLQEKKQQDLIYSTLRSYKEFKSMKGWDESGITLMFGSRGNDRIFIRLYEKRYELAQKLNYSVEEVLEEYEVWNRYELELGKEINPYVFARYLEGEPLEDIAIELLLSKIEVYEVVETKMGLKKEAFKEWYDIFGNWKKVKVTHSTEDTSIERTMRWIENQVAPSLKLLFKVFGKQWVIEWLLMCIDKAELTPEKEKLALFEEMKLEKNENGTFLYFNKKMEDLKRGIHS